MTYKSLLLAAALGLSLTACNKSHVASADAAPAPVAAPAPPPMPGAVAGSIAADRDGDGIVDGYYTPDGIYHPNYVAPPPPAPVLATRRGERG
jgi:hypothetical protein